MQIELLKKLRINHFGMAVLSIEKALRTYRNLGFSDVENREYEDELQNVRARFVQKDGIVLELLETLDRGRSSPLNGYLKFGAGILYHTCYETKRYEKTIEELCANRFRLIVPSIPGIGFQCRSVCFLNNRDIGLIELLDASDDG